MAMRNRVAVLALAVSLLLVALGGVASARLLVFSPQTVLGQAEVIVVAEVVSARRDPGEPATIEYRLRAEQVLKGRVREEELTVLIRPLRPLADPPELLPDPGTRVFVLLTRGDGGWRLAADLNAVAIVEGDRIVSLYRGARVGIDNEVWMPEDYLATYEAYYEERVQAEGDKEPRPSPLPAEEGAEDGAVPRRWWERFVHWLRSLFRELS